MPINILMPALSPTMEKGNLAKWHVKEGDTVSSGDVIAEIETDKATMEVEAVDEGTVARIIVPEGTADVPVNELIAVLAGEGEDASAAARSPEPSPQRGAGAPSVPGGSGDQGQAAAAKETKPSSAPAIPGAAQSGSAAGQTAQAEPTSPSPQRGEGRGEGAKTNGGGRIFV